MTLMLQDVILTHEYKFLYKNLCKSTFKFCSIYLCALFWFEEIFRSHIFHYAKDYYWFRRGFFFNHYHFFLYKASFHSISKRIAVYNDIHSHFEYFLFLCVNIYMNCLNIHVYTLDLISFSEIK